MQKLIFIINGIPNAGKDTFVSLVSEYVPTMNYSSVDKVKNIAKQIGWDGEKTEKDRKFLSDLKQLTTEYNDMSFEDIKKKVKVFREDSEHEFLFLHIREPHEIERAKKMFDAKTVLIKRPIRAVRSNLSDANVLNTDYDYIIDNDDTLDVLDMKALEFADSFKKEKLFVDLDNTVIDTIGAIVDLYNEDYSAYSEFEKIHPCQIENYEFKELTLASREYINRYFNQPRFFERVKFMENAKEVLELLEKKYQLCFVSMGWIPNLRLKEKWIKNNFPDADFIGISLSKHRDKSIIDMSNCVFIDDNFNMLQTSNAAVKICYGDYYVWNKDNDYTRLFNWKEIERYLLGD